MLPEPNPPFVADQDDAELEWLLCLASTLQARDQQAAKSAPEGQPLPQATLLARGQRSNNRGPAVRHRLRWKTRRRTRNRRAPPALGNRGMWRASAQGLAG